MSPSSPPPPYSSRTTSASNRNDLHLEFYYDNNGIPISMPGTIPTPPVISTVPINAGCYNPNIHPEHFPGLREGGGLTTPRGGRYLVGRDGIVEYLTEEEFQNRQNRQYIRIFVTFVLMFIVLCSGFLILHLIKNNKTIITAAQTAERQKQIAEEAERAAYRSHQLTNPIYG